MPFVADPSRKLDVTVSPPETALSSVTVNVIGSPSAALASETVTAAALAPPSFPSSSVMVPVAVSVAVTVWVVPDTARLTAKVSSFSSSVSSVVDTVRVFVSPAEPAKDMAAVFSV